MSSVEGWMELDKTQNVVDEICGCVFQTHLLPTLLNNDLQLCSGAQVTNLLLLIGNVGKGKRSHRTHFNCKTYISRRPMAGHEAWKPFGKI